MKRSGVECVVGSNRGRQESFSSSSDDDNDGNENVLRFRVQ